MTLTIEVDDDKALHELKTFLGEKKEMRLMNENSSGAITAVPEPPVRKEMTDEERMKRIRSSRGALNMTPDRIKAFEDYLQQTRDELE